MKITDLINESSITLNLKGMKKSEIISELCELHYKNKNINTVKLFIINLNYI